MEHDDAANVAVSGKRHRVVFTHRVDGDVRFISHRDALRLFQRALARASLPVAHSRGFNPQPRIMSPVPRPVGVASEVEYLVVAFEREVDPDVAMGLLQDQMPTGITMVSARHMAEGERLVPDMVRYRLAVDRASHPDLHARARQLLESDVVRVERVHAKTNHVRMIDVRQYVESVSVSENSVDFVLRLTGTGTAKPAEIAQVLGFEADSINHRIRRMEVRWRSKQ